MDKPDVSDKIGFLKEYRAHQENYLPMIDHQYWHFDKWEEEYIRNLGWDAGILRDNRPYFAEAWRFAEVTMMTWFISTKGIEQWKDEMLFMMELFRAGLITQFDPRNFRARIEKITDDHGNEFFSVNVTMGDSEHGQYVFGSQIYPYEALNELNESEGEN